jgi:outer membrane protein assembly factor BamA
MKYRFWLIACGLLNIVTVSAQQADTTRLPFAIADEKKLDPEDLEHKREGVYVTGVPDVSSDPVNGFGIGVEGSVYFNGKRNDPFFEYTPYRSKLDVTLFSTTRKQREIRVGYDVPYIFNSKWRLRAEAAYENNPNLLYFGIDETSLSPLVNPADGMTYKRYHAYENSLAPPYDFYNGYTKDEYIFNISAERSFWDSKMRALIGYEIARVGITTFNDSSLVSRDERAKGILGVGTNLVSFIQCGLVYDTRDLETDPNKGVFAEVTNELSLRVLGSAFDLNKTFAQVKFYRRILPAVFRKMVFASRVGMGYTAGDAPFYEYQDQWSSEGSIEGLGGGTTLRGFKQGRFLSRAMSFTNIELRYRFAEGRFRKEHFAMSAVPFADMGGVWDNFSYFSKWENYRFATGLGLRVAWNVNTILRFDYAVSKEDNQFFFTFGHAF